MRIVIVVTADRQPRSFRWGIRRGINQPNELPLSRADSHSGARRAAERVFGPLEWIDGAEAGADDNNRYVVQAAIFEIHRGISATVPLVVVSTLSK
jgi:hypothetical protein